ncbi:hypothetical protein D3C76_1322090 [compost metagenome]
MGSIHFARPGGSGAGMIDGSSIGLLLTSFGTLFLGSVGGGVQVQGSTDFRDYVQFSGGVGGIGMSSISGLQTELSSIRSLVNEKPSRSQTATNMTFDSTTRNLKLYSITGDTLAIVNIPS